MAPLNLKKGKYKGNLGNISENKFIQKIERNPFRKWYGNEPVITTNSDPRFESQIYGKFIIVLKRQITNLHNRPVVNLIKYLMMVI